MIIKNFTKLFLLITLMAVVFFSSSAPVFAEFAPVEKPELSYSFGAVFDEVDCPNGVCSINWLGLYIAALYRYGVGLVAVLAVVAVMVGGFIYIASAGAPDRIKTAKSIIFSAFSGLTIAMFSFIILQTINPRLVALDPLTIKGIPSAAPGGVVGNLYVGPDGYIIDPDVATYIKRNEGFRNECYRDTLGNWTIGYGHQVDDCEQRYPNGITRDQAEALFASDLAAAIAAANNYVGTANYNSLSEARQMVLADMAFNLGPGGLNGFTKLKDALEDGLDSNDYTQAANEIRNSTYCSQVPNRCNCNAQIMQSNIVSC